MKKFTTIALVTGATRGIGKAIAKALSASDTYIIGTATSAQGAEVISTYFDEDQINGEGRVFNAGSFENTKKLRRSGRAGILAGSLEMVKEGSVIIKQNNLFDEIFIKKINE